MADDLHYDASLFVLIQALNNLRTSFCARNPVWIMLFEKQMDMLVEAWRLEKQYWEKQPDKAAPASPEPTLDKWRRLRDVWLECFGDDAPWTVEHGERSAREPPAVRGDEAG